MTSLRCAVAHRGIFEIPRIRALTRRPGMTDDIYSAFSLKVARNGWPGIDADDAKFAREEFQFLQREGEPLVLGMAVDVGIELRGEEIAVDHVAFELGHVDAVGGKTAHRLVERGRAGCAPGIQKW